MVLLCKQKALYVKCCIIPNGVTDSQGDTLYSEDIKKIFTTFNNQDNFEIYHNDIPIQEVSLLENYISTTDESIGTAVVPAGSWNAVIRVDNPEIQEGLLTGEFKGVSLNNRIADKCKANLHGTIRYKDVPDAECVIPLLISFVEAGANGYGLHVMDYPAYIKKSNTNSKKGVLNMEFREFLDGLKVLIKKAEDTPDKEEEPAILKEDNVDPTEETVEPVKDKEPVEKPTDEKEEEAEIKKEDSDLEDRVAKIEEQLAELIEAKKDEEVVEEADESVETDEAKTDDSPKITKSEKVIVETAPVQNNNYYEVTGRDPVTGIKIR